MNRSSRGRRGRHTEQANSSAAIPPWLRVSGGTVLLILGFAISMAMLATRAEQVSGFLSELFKGSDPFYAQGRTVTARDLLDAAAARIAKDLKTQPAVRARLREVMGDAYVRLGVLDRADEMFSALIADRELVYGSGSVPVARAYRERGDVRRQRSQQARSGIAVGRQDQ
jgi:hypothetical protein